MPKFLNHFSLTPVGLIFIQNSANCLPGLSTNSGRYWGQMDYPLFAYLLEESRTMRHRLEIPHFIA